MLRSECSSYEDLQDYLHLRGREAYLQKRVSIISSLDNWGLLNVSPFEVMFVRVNVTIMSTHQVLLVIAVCSNDWSWVFQSRLDNIFVLCIRLLSRARHQA